MTTIRAVFVYVFVLMLGAIPVYAQKPKPPSATDFQVLVDQVSALSNQVTTLTTQVTTLTTQMESQGAFNNQVYNHVVTINNQIAKLESGAVTANDIVGTYALVSHLTTVGEPASVTAGHDVGTLTFHADGTGTLRKTSRASGLVGSPMVLSHHSGAPIDTPFNWQLTATGLSGPFGQAIVTAGGRFLLWTYAVQLEHITGTYELLIAARLPAVQ